ncbi:ATP-binding protein [Streptomyces sp. NPDC054861]
MNLSRRQRFPDSLISAGLARAFTSDTLALWGATDRLDDIQLCVTEFLANAVRHAGGPVALALRVEGSDVVLEVEDSSPCPPLLRPPDCNALDGRGLLLVAALADEWGWHGREGGKTVWCRLGPGRSAVS